MTNVPRTLPPSRHADKHGTAKRVLIRFYGRTEADCRDPEKCYAAMVRLGYKWDERRGIWRS